MNTYTHEKLREKSQFLFKTKLMRSLFTQFLNITGKPYFFGPFGKEIGFDYPELLSKNPISYPNNIQDIHKYAHIQFQNISDFSQKNVALIAHYDPDALIDPYVLHYCKHLKNLGYSIIIASDQALHISNMEKEITDLIDAIVYRTCLGYDFTSHKCAFHLFPSLYNANQVIMANDSIYAPLGSFQTVIDTMNKIPCDYWGLIEKNSKTYAFLHSYFLAFNKTTLQHKAFKDFINSILCDDNKEIAYKYEEDLTLFLYSQGLKPAAFLPAASNPYLNFNPLKRAWQQLPAIHIPLIKRNIYQILKKENKLKRTHCVLKKYNYPIELIINYSNRTEKNEKLKVK